MSNKSQKVKKEKKAKERREKALRARASLLAQKKAEREDGSGLPSQDKPDFRGDRKQSASKPAGPFKAQIHRTQGK